MKWADKTFTFNDSLLGKRREFIETLEQTSEVIKKLVKDVPEEMLMRQVDEKWSIKENIGHLITVDMLFFKRLDDYEANAEELFPAEMSGNATYKADYNQQPLADILEKLEQSRLLFAERVKAYPDEMFERSSYHRRLDTQMRLIDMLHFMVEHDSYHLNRIKELSSGRRSTQKD